MSLILELPAPLQDELNLAAKREGRSPEDLASLLFCLATSLREDANETPFRMAVKSFLSSHEVDPDRLASTLQALREVCSEQKPSPETEASGGSSCKPLDEATILKSWNHSIVHLPPAETLIQAAGPAPRPSARGKAAQLKVSTEDVYREHQQDIELEEKGWH